MSARVEAKFSLVRLAMDVRTVGIFFSAGVATGVATGSGVAGSVGAAASGSDMDIRVWRPKDGVAAMNAWLDPKSSNILVAWMVFIVTG